MGPNGQPATFKFIATEALLAVLDDEKGLSGKEKYDRFNLTHKINKAEGAVDLSAEEIAKIKELIGKCFRTLVVGAAYDVIESVDRNPASKNTNSTVNLAHSDNTVS